MEFLIAGLGNPGAEYENTRHNIGFYFLDALSLHWGGGGVEWREKWRALYCSLAYNGHKIHCLKPQTYMNRSGESVGVFSHFFKIPPENLVVVHDDLDMPPARVKFIKGGGSGGHNGIKSLVDCLGENGFYRLKIGIGRPGQGDVHPDFPVERYVLGRFTAEETRRLDERQQALCAGFEEFIGGDTARATGIFNSLK